MLDRDLTLSYRNCARVLFSGHAVFCGGSPRLSCVGTVIASRKPREIKSRALHGVKKLKTPYKSCRGLQVNKGLN